MDEWVDISESDIEELLSQNKQYLLVDLINGTRVRYGELLASNDFSLQQKNQIVINENNQISLLKKSLDNMLMNEFSSLLNNYSSSDDLMKVEINKRINEIINFYRSYFKNDEYADYLEQLFQSSLVSSKQVSSLEAELDELSGNNDKAFKS